MNGMDAIEHDAAGISRRVLLGSSLGAIIAAAGAARTADAGIGFSALHHGANDPLPPAAVSVNQSMFPGFRQTFVRTHGVMVDGKLAEGAVINTADRRERTSTAGGSRRPPCLARRVSNPLIRRAPDLMAEPVSGVAKGICQCRTRPTNHLTDPVSTPSRSSRMERRPASRSILQTPCISFTRRIS